MLLLGVVAFVMLLASAIDRAWVQFSADDTYTGGSGEEQTGTIVARLGPTDASVDSPTFDSISKMEYTARIVTLACWWRS